MLGFIITFLKTYFHVYILLGKTTIALWRAIWEKLCVKRKNYGTRNIGT
jgi:hypothetical protein